MQPQINVPEPVNNIYMDAPQQQQIEAAPQAIVVQAPPVNIVNRMPDMQITMPAGNGMRLSSHVITHSTTNTCLYSSNSM